MICVYIDDEQSERISLFIIFLGARMEPRALHIPGKRLVTKLRPQPCVEFLKGILKTFKS